MEKLVKELMTKHNLSAEQAQEAIAMVGDYLKEKNPMLQKLIDNVLSDQNNGTDTRDTEA